MRQFLPTLVLSIIVAGCSNAQPPNNVTVTQPPPQAVDTQTTPSPAVVTSYPEHNEVVRLLHRATEQERMGQFASALDLVNQALHLDGNSPSATTKKAHLEKIVTKI